MSIETFKWSETPELLELIRIEEENFNFIFGYKPKHLESLLRIILKCLALQGNRDGDFFQYIEKFDKFFIKLRIVTNENNKIYLRYAVFEDFSFKNDHYNSDEDLRTCEWDREIFFVEKILDQYLHKRINLLNAMNIRFDRVEEGG